MTNPNNLYNGINERLFYTLGKRPDNASIHDFYMALSYAVRDQMMNYWLSMKPSTGKEVAYLSAEFLIGPQLGNNLICLGIKEDAEEALKKYGYTLDQILDVAEEPGLGNGGLGRLAACYMDSLATLKVPATGYGIRYKYGIFKQEIRDNQQIEITDNWLHGECHGNFVILMNPSMLGLGVELNITHLTVVTKEFVGFLRRVSSLFLMIYYS